MLPGARFAPATPDGFLLTAFTSGGYACLLMESYGQSGAGCGEAIVQEEEFESLKKPRLTPRRVVAGAVASGAAGTGLPDGIQMNDDILVIAHRGAADRAPNNTHAAFRAAF